MSYVPYIQLLPLALVCCAVSINTHSNTDVGSKGPSILGTASELTIGPIYIPARELALFGRFQGNVCELAMQSAHSKFYPGVARRKPNLSADLWMEDRRFRGLGITPDMWIHAPEESTGFPRSVINLPELRAPGVHPYQRAVKVYVPPGMNSSMPAPFLVINDGGGLATPMIPILETLIREGRIPSIVALFIDAGGDDAQGSQRGAEYDAVSGDFADFVEAEVVPLVSARCGVLLTADPNGRAVMGTSSGGMAAFSMAWHRPELFRRVLAYSPTFVNQQYPVDPAYPHGGWEYHSGKQLIINNERKPLRVGIFDMEHDLGWSLGEETYRNFHTANLRMAAALQQMGYDYRHILCKAASHVDMRVVLQTLPSALEWLWQGHQH